MAANPYEVFGAGRKSQREYIKLTRTDARDIFTFREWSVEMRRNSMNKAICKGKSFTQATRLARESQPESITNMERFGKVQIILKSLKKNAMM